LQARMLAVEGKKDAALDLAKAISRDFPAWKGLDNLLKYIEKQTILKNILKNR